MALIVKISRANENGAQALQSLRQAAEAFAAMERVNRLLAQAIAVGTAEVIEVFGVEDAQQAQALADRFNAFVAAHRAPGEGQTEMANLVDLIYAVTAITT